MDASELRSTVGHNSFKVQVLLFSVESMHYLLSPKYTDHFKSAQTAYGARATCFVILVHFLMPKPKKQLA